MKSTIYRRGRVAIPAALRAKYDIKTGNQLVWINNGQTIRVIPIPSNPIAALYRRGKGQRLMKQILKERAKDNDNPFYIIHRISHGCSGSVSQEMPRTFQRVNVRK